MINDVESFLEQLNFLLDDLAKAADKCEEISSAPVITQERYWVAAHKARDLQLKVSGHTRCTEQFLDVAGKIANELFKSQE